MLSVSPIDPFSTPPAAYISVRVDNVTRELFATLTDILLLSSVPFHLLRSSNARLTTILTSGPRISDLALYRQFCQFFCPLSISPARFQGFFLRGVRVAIRYESHCASCTTRATQWRDRDKIYTRDLGPQFPSQFGIPLPVRR